MTDMASSEKAFVLWFNAFTGDGLPISLTVRADAFSELQKHLADVEKKYPNLGSFGLLFAEPPAKKVAPSEFHITGWLRGETNDVRGTGTKPCVYLYSDIPHLDFKVTSVFFEQLWKLPPEIDWKNKRSVGNQAPLRSLAQRQNILVPCDMKIVMVPRFDYEGNPVMNKTGNSVAMAFSHVVGYDPEPPEIQTTETDGARNKPQAPARQQEAPARQPAPNTGTGACPVCHAPAGKPHATGCTNAGGGSKPTAKATASTSRQVDAGLDELAYFAGITNDFTIEIPDEIVPFVSRVRDSDRSSRGQTLTVSRPATDTEKAKVGQYEFLCGIIDNIVGVKLHGEVLSFLTGRVVSKESPLGANCRWMLDETYAGKKDKPNERFNQATVDILNKIGAFVLSLQANADAEIPF